MRLSSLRRAQKSLRSTAVKPRTAEIFTFPAPTRGWNARDSLAGMQLGDAITLDNYYPTTADVSLRNGMDEHATGLSTFVETLLTYKTGVASKMFAATSGGSIFDVSSPGAVGAAAVTGMTNGRWQWVNFTTSGGNFLSLVNGADTPRQYDGTNWIASAMTGLTTANLINVFIYKRRLFFIEKEKLKLWYLPVDSITGALTAFDVSAQFSKGGYLMAGGSLTRDGGDGMDDLFVVISSEGQVLIYQGLDPASDFAKIGLYDIGKPLGRRCLEKTGADLAALTVDGIVGISQIITLDRSAGNKVALSERIRNVFNTSAVVYKNNFGWQLLSYPLAKQGSMVFANVPIVERSEQHQYVMNATTQSWCRFKGWNANCWVLFNDLIYFGGSGTVYLADTGLSDNGAALQGTIQTSFAYPNESVEYKEFKSVRTLLITDPALAYGVTLVTDFSNQFTIAAVSYDPGSSGSVWDVATWDVDPWSTVIVVKDFHDQPASGICVSAVFYTETMELEVKFNAMDIVWERGSIQP